MVGRFTRYTAFQQKKMPWSCDTQGGSNLRKMTSQFLDPVLNRRELVAIEAFEKDQEENITTVW